MNKAGKAAILSALVFPGAGHLYLKKKYTGFMFLGIAGWALYMIMTSVMARAQLIVNQIESPGMPLDIVTIGEMVAKQTQQYGNQPLDAPLLVLIICWILAIVDSYRLGQAATNE